MNTSLNRTTRLLAAAVAAGAGVHAAAQTTTIDGGVITEEFELSSGELVINGPVEYRPDPDVLGRPFLVVNESGVATVNGPISGLEARPVAFSANNGGTLTVNGLTTPDNQQLLNSGGEATIVFNGVSASQNFADIPNRPLAFIDGGLSNTSEGPTRLRIVDSTLTTTPARPFINGARGSIALEVQGTTDTVVEVINSAITDVWLGSTGLTGTFTDATLGSLLLTGGNGGNLTFSGGSITVDGETDFGGFSAGAFTSSSFGRTEFVDGAAISGPNGFFSGGGNSVRFDDVSVTGVTGEAVTLLLNGIAGEGDLGTALFESGTFVSAQGFSTLELGRSTEAVIRGGSFTSGVDDPGLFTLLDDASLTLVGDLSTFELNFEALAPEDVAAGEALIDSPAGTLRGILDNGDVFEINFQQEVGTTFRVSQTGEPIDPGTPNAVPSPSAAAAGVLMGMGLLRRRRQMS